MRVKAKRGEVRAMVTGAKTLERAMIGYGEELSKESGISYADAVAKMNRDPDAVARKVGASSGFVKVWTDMELMRKRR